MTRLESMEALPITWSLAFIKVKLQSNSRPIWIHDILSFIILNSIMIYLLNN